MFLRNAWYVAAWDHEVGQETLPTKILGERIVLYRTEAGEPVALEDACAHRKLPLSMGRRKGDAIECGYHGLTFDKTGRCIHMPAANRIPPAVRVRSYPLRVRLQGGRFSPRGGVLQDCEPARRCGCLRGDMGRWKSVV